VGTLRAKTIRYPGAHGLNTIEATLVDENTRYGAVVTNGVVDSSGKLTSRKDFINQTSAFSNTVKALWTHRATDGTESIMSAAAGQVYSGVGSLTSRFDYRAGYQFVDVGGAKTDASTTGLANTTTTYGLTVAVDGGAAQQVTVTGSSGQTYSNLITAINVDLTGASCSLVGGNLKFISASNGVGSSIAVLNTAGTASVALLATLSNFVAVRVASAGTITSEDWQFASFSGEIYMAQKGRQFTALNESTFAQVSIIGQPWSNSVNCVIAAYGRLWAADDENGGVRNTVWWSNLLDGLTWNSGDAGSLDVSNAWPKGQDSVVAIAAAFSRLFIFGRKSILLYTLPATNAPTGMTLTDVIEDLGCVARDSVQVTDTGVYFLSDNGIYRIDKFAQTTTLMALPQVSYLYNDEVLTQIAAETATNIRSGYYPTEGYYVLSFPTSNITFAVMTRKVTPLDGNRLVGLKWTNTGRPFYAFTFDKSGNWYSGGVNGVHKYSGYTPDGASNNYTLTWTGLWHPFEDESRLKHAKGVTLVVEAASGQTGTFEWKTDYLAGTTNSNAFTCSAVEFAENPGVGNVSFQIGRSFKVIQPSVSFAINGNKVTLHQVRIYATPGAVKMG
jgi:hypothetical protein